MRSLPALLIAAGLFASGCSTQTAAPTAVATARTDGDHDHDHDHDQEHTRDHMKETHAGKYHIWLTAHLSKEGNELDMIFETGDHDHPKPGPIPVKSFTAKAKRMADDKEFELTFEPAPKEERKSDPDGACSHFVAKAPWLTAADTLLVTAEVELDGKPRKPTWRTFIIKKYTHHAD